jgi:hypothetical protein
MTSWSSTSLENEINNNLSPLFECYMDVMHVNVDMQNHSVQDDDHYKICILASSYKNIDACHKIS